MSVETKTQLEEEQFPQLPIRKQEECTSASRRSSISSVSSLSVCSLATNEPTTNTTDIWFKQIGEHVVCRRRMFCKVGGPEGGPCKKCARTRLGLLSKKNWNDLTRYPCDEAVALEAGDVVKLVSMRNYGKKGGPLVYVFGTIWREELVKKWHYGEKTTEYEYRPRKVEGWVYPDYLGGVQAVRKALQQKEVAKNVLALKEVFLKSRKESHERKQVATFVPETVVPQPAFLQSQYQFNELVLARDALGHPWFQAEVTSTNPLKLKCSSWEGVRIFDERNVKKYPSSKFVVVQNMDVRTREHPESFVKKTLPKGSVFHVVQMNGFHARITSPECGWVQMRSVTQLFAIEEDYEFEYTQPRMFLGGLPLNATIRDVSAALQRIEGVDGVVVPSNIQLFASGDSLCAYLHLMRSNSYKKIVGKEIVVNGQRVSCDYCIKYLRCQAARKLRRS